MLQESLSCLVAYVNTKSKLIMCHVIGKSVFIAGCCFKAILIAINVTQRNADSAFKKDGIHGDLFDFGNINRNISLLLLLDIFLIYIVVPLSPLTLIYSSA